MAGFPKVYRSFSEFEREELRKLDALDVVLDDMIDEMMMAELDFDHPAEKRSRRKNDLLWDE